jgi:hypothetical protein
MERQLKLQAESAELEKQKFQEKLLKRDAQIIQQR